jgi:hypothetical protein
MVIVKDMSTEYIIQGILGAILCGFICGGWLLLGDVFDKWSTRRWDGTEIKNNCKKS